MNIEHQDKQTHVSAPPSVGTARELADAALDDVTGGLVVNAIIAVLIGQLLPSVQKQSGDLTRDQVQQLRAGNPLPRPR